MPDNVMHEAVPTWGKISLAKIRSLCDGVL
jgi:hypothetical protein